MQVHPHHLFLAKRHHPQPAKRNPRKNLRPLLLPQRLKNQSHLRTRKRTKERERNEIEIKYSPT
jgi:hypothetical protein